jgi:hypothetical protein
MNRKRVGLGGLVVTLLCLGTAPAADMPGPYTGPGAPPAPPPSVDGALPPPVGPAPYSQPSTFIDYPRCLGCCGPVGANGPINYEVYTRAGWSIPLGDNPFGGHHMNAGWEVAVGARTLFFNPESDAAWTADIGVSNTFTRSSDRSAMYTLFNIFDPGTSTTIPTLDVAIKDVNRTYLNLAGGREWYLLGSANCDEPQVNVRVGFDVGGGWGTEKLEATNLPRHQTDVIGRAFFALHGDVEIPHGCCIIVAGFRTEYSYTWSDILQSQNDSDTQEINLLFNLGLRF